MWLYHGRNFTEAMAEGYVGFVYLIENTVSGRKYIGKKLFKRTRRTPKRKKSDKVQRRKKIVTSSDWETYYGSNKELLLEMEVVGPETYKRTILHLCKSKGTCSYLELKEQILHGALESDLYYNSWIMARIRKEHIKI